MAQEQKTYELVVEPRETLGKQSKKLRRQDIIPGVVYGQQTDPQPIQVAQRELERVYLRAGSTGLVDLKIGEESRPRKVFIHNVQRNPVNHVLSHVDFLVVNLRQEMTVTVPLTFVGESPAVLGNEGVLLQALDHVQIRALPGHLPSQVEVDVSGLVALDDAIHVSDLEIPADATLLTDPEELVAKITALRAEEEEPVDEDAEVAEGEEGEGDEADASSDESEASGEAR